MRITAVIGAAALLLAAVRPALAQTADNLKGQSLIIETDMGNDIDDALALALAYQGVKDGKLDLMMVSNHKKSLTASDFIDILNTYYGYPEITVAKCATPVFNGQYRDYTAPVVLKDDPVWRRSGNYEGEYPEAVAKYRELLAGKPDKSVVIVSLGFGTTLAQLLDSQPDRFSSYTGKELVKKKVKYLSIMAGSYGPEDTVPVNGVRDTMFDSTKKRAEYNVVNDIPAMQKVFAEWPGKIVQNPFELGKMVMYPWSAVDKQGAHPVFDAYRAYRKEPYDRPSWDILSVAYVLHPELFNISDPVTVTVDDKGFNHVKPGGNHRILTLTREQADALKAYEVAETTRGPEYLPAWEEGMMDIHSIGTGQGDASFLILPDGTTWMIDAGDIGTPNGAPNWYHAVPDRNVRAGHNIIRYINHFSPTPGHLDYAMLTHFHADHMGTKGALEPGEHGFRRAGILLVGDEMEIDKYIDRDYPDYDFPSREQVMKACNIMPEYFKFLDYKKSQGTVCEKLDVGSNRQFVLKHNPKAYKGQFEVRNLCGNARVWTGRGTGSKPMYSGDTSLFDENMNSCGVLVRYGDFTYYNCGDLGGGNIRNFASDERYQESYIADVAGKVTVLKNDHHGWKESTNAKFLAATRPQTFVIMGSHRQHPYSATMQRMVDPLVYAGARDYYITTESSRKNLGESLWQHFKPAGHIVVRVHPGGKTYEVFVLDIYSGDYRIKYRSGIKNVER